MCFSHLREHKFRHNFHDTINPTTQFVLHCSNYFNERMTLLANRQNAEKNILDRNYFGLSEILLLSDSSFNNEKTLVF